jgi:hypothetical protein
MKDTPPEMDARYQDMLMQRSGEERLIMGCAMHETARTLVETSIRELDPQASLETVRKGIFLRFYGHEFDADSRRRFSPPSSLQPIPSPNSRSSHCPLSPWFDVHPLVSSSFVSNVSHLIKGGVISIRERYPAMP